MQRTADLNTAVMLKYPAWGMHHQNGSDVKLHLFVQWTAELNAAITQKFFAWLVGPLEVQDAEIEYRGVVKTWKSSVQIKKCRYLEQSGCKGMCINMCKVSI